MEFKFQIEGIDEAKKLVSPDLLKKILRKTINQTAQDAKAELKEEMKRVFDNPTPFTLNSVYTRSDPQELSVRIGLKEWAGKGTSAAEYLKPQILGGPRPMKRSEKLLGNFYVPGTGAKLNQYGNIPPSLITQVISAVGRFKEVGFLMNVTAGSRKRNRKPRNFFMVGKNNKGLHAGVWERKANNQVKPILIFVDQPTYSPRFDFFGVVKKTVAQRLTPNFDEALRRAKTINL